ncbi:Ubiquitin-related domain containing protein [Trema orientale]|uniref:Ubiquitin-related domain containing protein n=1 Tax=Trema orientale TaxID=63057 RepID=A0A2P5EX18_TREOI|nr:Ubiquitin-related domain containing protein [Trema orientale]
MRSNRGTDHDVRVSANSLKVLIEMRCLGYLLKRNDDVDGRDSVRSFNSYQKLPQLQYLKLSVLKLDGSAFDVLVVKNATVAELKKGIEQVFSSSSKEAQDNISWSLVWGHFCLCYDGQKLINDKAHVRNYGIKEGDQLQFVRHMSINHSPLKKIRPKRESIAWKKDSGLSSGSNDMSVVNKGKEIDQEYNYKLSTKEDDEENGAPPLKMAHFLRGLLSYSSLWGVWRRGSYSSDGRTSRPTRFSLHFL